MSEYSDKFEAYLRICMIEWAEEHRWDALEAVTAFGNKVKEQHVDGRGYYGWTGPMSHDIAWYADKIIAAEVISGAAQFILRNFEEHPDAPASEVLANLKDSLKRTIIEGLEHSSTGRFHNPVAQSVGIAANGLLTNNWAFASIEFAAASKTEAEVVPEQIINMLKEWKEKERAINSKLRSARSETRIAKYNEELRTVEGNVAIYTGLRDKAIMDAKEEGVIQKGKFATTT